ncbi:MAG: hypothetical protein NW203_08370 [Hyphomonadaceae bacterium]|nr:hypothetical protein [Hyphomonadaceae bacterium]
MRIMALAAAALACAMAACAPANPPAAPAAEAADPLAPLTVEGLDVACNAAYQRRCDAAGCAPIDGNEIAVPIAFSWNGTAGTGELCIATGCHAMFLAPLPGDAPSPGDDIMAVVLSPGTPETEGAGPGPFLDGIVSLPRDGSSFQFIQGGVNVWGGACTAPPAPAP